ncbi:diguanylate cyclase [Ruminococcus sp. OA3]|uniref:diguanylate cyclase n=1 Tax=Ruminococcus sp. OA3 TaxID=2914164 RepID=UPI001F05A474|nr:diguanylate cyclase [Ruminococcus sp. OA3]MCH1983498.1 diguanylate cyclase [Ruminococcus sp. OA3]
MKEICMIKIEKLLKLIEDFKLIYDVVRIVDPHDTSVISYRDGRMQKIQLEPCFAVWEKGSRCDNCVSLRACMEKKRISKFEFRKDDVYSVVSMPFIVTDAGQQYLAALELVNNVSDDMVLHAHGQSTMADEVKKMNQKVYEDSLTGVFNRRYYDERRYIYEMTNEVPREIGYLAIDVNHFKYVNDAFGHDRGDELLVLIADILKKNVRQSDRIMRVGGDEFLVVLRNCSQVYVEKIMEKIQKAVSGLSIDGTKRYRPSIAIGMAYTEHFDGNPGQLRKLFQKADTNMYHNKKMISGNAKNMLVVDHVREDRKLLQEYLQTEIQIYEAEDAVQALEILKNRVIEIVVVDIDTSNGDGFLLIKKIRNILHMNDLIVVAVTERGQGSQIEALGAGADDFLIKPFSCELVRHRIKAVLLR